MGVFYLNRNTKVLYAGRNETVQYAITRFYQDLARTLDVTEEPGSQIVLDKVIADPEQFFLQSPGDGLTLNLHASDELGVIYGLLYLSETYLGIHPFWFWNDQHFQLKDRVEVEIGEYASMPMPVRYRGWFINDEVLLLDWHYEGDPEKTWEMAMDALLRCGGNMVIPGTDTTARKNRKLAKKMGLYISHHHAEPLGAEMFLRAYPDLNPSFDEHADLFRQLWKDGIDAQKDQKVIWNLGFRGQGDRPFWVDDPRYDSDAARGRLISTLIQEQYDMVQAAVPGAPTCTNLYGEMMDLYKEGHLSIPADVIKIWADNGYGRMVNRRIGNHNPRIPALPGPEYIPGSQHGIYYHVSFYDLYTANHMTMFPNSVDFIEKELSHAFQAGAKDYLIVNCSNIKPHIYYLDALRKIWSGKAVSTNTHSREFVRTYFSPESAPVMAPLWEKYAAITVPFGPNEDEHAGEQFYVYFPRIFITHILRGEGDESIKQLHWATGDIPLSAQIDWFVSRCASGLARFEDLEHECRNLLRGLGDTEGQLLEDTLLLQVQMHRLCLQGCVAFGEAYKHFILKEYQDAFYQAGRSAECYLAANQAMRDREHDHWKGFYRNDCLTDIKFTAYSLHNFMAYVRNFTDGPDYYHWMRDVMYPGKDAKIILLTNTQNHLNDEELFQEMKKQKEEK